MKNFQIKDAKTGKLYWISRSLAVCGFIIVGNTKTPTFKFLVSQRGKGAADNVGSWQCTCGYLDYDETAEEAMIREVYEELGLDLTRLPHATMNLLSVMSDPKKDTLQNVSLRFLIELLEEDLDIPKLLKNLEKNRGGEEKEVSDIKLISPEEIDNYTWAFNHGEILKEIANLLTQSINQTIEENENNI